ncbi:unnamed protein product [Rotaria socialis]|uniref:Cytochrome P450 n=1 Tax=Rotaria socialis TaxID=392032 RepID=A0A818MZU8_9BILA|nr:unnamed protein product [Rotaria socialis]CAF3598074.1 unnamed protein product [Rotaria socialis]CAF3610933.1 unnamed protein product [Rotaria socialis]CAF4247286.1 unnamed protein product [Rotaria socialis]CAF4568729.1 unnamed protein product [Rotaria socialis]
MTPLFLIVVPFVMLLIRFRQWKKCKPSNITISTANEAHKILKSSDYNRQKPNEWLIETLSIVNPFTINDASLQKAFKTNAMKILTNYTNQQNYEKLVLTIRNRIQHRITLLQLKNRKFCLSKLAKQVTLDCFLTEILGVHANEDLLTELPELIIHLWKNRNDKTAKDRLKQIFQTHNDQFSQSKTWQQIKTILSERSNIISNMSTNDFDEKISNPLNIIVPGWETMWRVVFYTLLELIRRPNLVEQLCSQFNEHSKSYRDCLLLEWILKETLRLYPPTKNIYRTNLNTGENVCISVQQIHRDKTVWGSDALNFNPYRFKDILTPEQQQSYLPFSISCPARFGFAYKFAGAIVAEILNFGPNFSIAKEFESMPPTDKLLDLVRDSYNDLLINI